MDVIQVLGFNIRGLDAVDVLPVLFTYHNMIIYPQKKL